jgi:glutamate-ammonia-ligase adenylyltransferase
MPDATTPPTQPPTQAGREVAVRRQRFVEAGGTLPVTAADKLLFEAILASGEFLPELLFADPGALPRLIADPWLRRAKPPEVMAREVRAATVDAAGLAEVQRGLRRVRRYEMLRLGAREIGWGTTDEVARELSAFADACLDAAVSVCDAELRRELGEPRDSDGAPVRFVVMGMGKLGGDELNFSSDVDVCYFYSTDAGAAGGSSLHEYYSELSRRVSAALEQATADGTVFRVDLRLRPEGRNGPMCNSLAAAEEYYETFGRTWERQAWLRARPVAGDRALGEELLATLEPFIYPRSIDPRMVDDVRALRAMFRDPADAAGELGETGFDVKLGAGGIRDVEMVVQALQLLHAGKRPDLRERNTPKAFPRLVVAGLLSDREAWTLLSAYRFWRRLEHRVMVATGAQRHRIPGDADARARFADGLGFATLAAFDAEVAAKRAAVEAIAATLGDPPPERSLEAARLLDPMRDRADLERLAAAAGFRDPESAADTLEAVAARLSPALLEQAIASPEPDRALLHFRELVARGSGGLLALLRDEPQLGRMLGTLFGTSDRLAELLLGNPMMWDAFVGGLGAGVRTREQMQRRLEEYRHPGAEGAEAAGDQHVDDYEEAALRAVRRFQAEELLRVGLHDVAGSLDAQAVAEELTDLADVCLDAGIAATLPALTARLGAPRTGLTVLGLGSLGAREIRYGSDLDLVFLYGEDGESTAGVDHREWFARASQRFIFAMETMLEEGRLYKVDARLRPSGEQGLLVTSWASFERYHRGEAAEWERAALMRARIVFSNEQPATRAQREATLQRIGFDSAFDRGRFVADLRRVRGRVTTERGRVPAGSRHIKLDAGGIMDIELLVALGQLENAGDAALRTTVTARALARLQELGWPAALADDYAGLRRVALRLRLLRDRPEDIVSPLDLPVLGRSLGTTADALAAELDERMTRIRATFDERFR